MALRFADYVNGSGPAYPFTDGVPTASGNTPGASTPSSYVSTYDTGPTNPRQIGDPTVQGPRLVPSSQGTDVGGYIPDPDVFHLPIYVAAPGTTPSKPVSPRITVVGPSNNGGSDDGTDAETGSQTDTEDSNQNKFLNRLADLMGQQFAGGGGSGSGVVALPTGIANGGGGSSILPLLLIGGLVVGGIWYFRRKKKASSGESK